jgi:hypothetical protein
MKNKKLLQKLSTFQIESQEGSGSEDDQGGNGFFRIFDYDQTLVPPEPNFFTAGLSLDMTDK